MPIHRPLGKAEQERRAAVQQTTFRKLQLTPDGCNAIDRAVLEAIGKLEARARKQKAPRPRVSPEMLLDASFPDAMVECRWVGGTLEPSPYLVKHFRSFTSKVRVRLVENSLDRLHEAGALVVVMTRYKGHDLRSYQLRDF